MKSLDLHGIESYNTTFLDKFKDFDWDLESFINLRNVLKAFKRDFTIQNIK